MHSELANDRPSSTISIRSVHLRLKYLHEESDSLQSICQTLEALSKFWVVRAKEEKDEVGTAGVSAVDDLRLLRYEFYCQITSRDELVQRLGNVQNLVWKPNICPDFKISNLIFSSTLTSSLRKSRRSRKMIVLQ
jgi:hypothetical protein